jgi:hypothetical protein
MNTTTATPAAAGTVTTRAPASMRQRHAYAAFPHRPHPTAVCKTCCAEMAAEFAAGELALLDQMIERDPDSEIIGASSPLPF